MIFKEDNPITKDEAVKIWINRNGLMVLDEIAKNAIMTAYVDIPCSDVKLNIEEVFITDENRKMDTIGVIGNQDKITKFIEKAKCNRIRIFHVKKGW